MKLKNGDVIELKNQYCGPKGSFPPGTKMTVGVALDVKECELLLAGGYAVSAQDKPAAPAVETPAAEDSTEKKPGVLERISKRTGMK